MSTVNNMKEVLPLAAKKAIGYIDELNATEKDYDAYAAGIDAIAEKMKKDIAESESVYDPSNVTFYVSNGGDDDADGKSPETAWKTLKNVNDKTKVCENCNVLFERGGIWREALRVPCNGMTFSAYGKGMKPRFYGSRRNYAKPEYWKKSEFKNVWYTDLCTKNVGLIAFNHSDELGKYDEIMGYRHSIGRDGFTGPQDLTKNYDFYGHLDEEKCYLYCDKGNPGEVYESLELGEAVHLMVPVEGKIGLTFDNLMLKFTGCHGIAGLGGCQKVTVQNCIMCYLGGSILDGFAGSRTVGFGNAVETYGSCNGYWVNGNWIYQIYDTAITHQFSQCNASCHMQDVEYTGNLCEYCHWSIEFYNQPTPGYHRSVYDTNVHHNILRCGGMGWGSRGREEGAALFNSFTLPEDTKNFVTHDNIYDRSAGNIVRLNRGGDEKIEAHNNTYIQKKGGSLGWIFDGVKTYDGDVKEKIREYIKEEDARFYFSK